MSIMIKKLFVILMTCSAYNLTIAKKFATYPVPPYAGDEVTALDMLNEAKVIDDNDIETDGFKVIDPNGSEFYVDDILNPKCAFYANVLEVEEGAFVNPTTQIQQTVNINSINFDTCF